VDFRHPEHRRLVAGAGCRHVSLQISATVDFTSPMLSVENTSATTSYTFENLTDDTTYWYRVRVRKTTGFLSEWSDPTSSTQDNGFPTGTLQINGGAPYTGSTTVSLGLTWLDPGTQPSGVTHMRLNDGAGWSDWETVAANRTWTLSTGDGERALRVEFRDAVGNVSTTATQALIWLDTVNPDIPGTPEDQGLYSRTGHLTFTWTEPLDSDGSGVAYYRYEITSGPAFSSATLVTTGTVAGPTLNFDGVSGTVYYCRVQAVDHAENAGPISLPSDGILVDTLVPPIPTAPVDEGEFSSSTLLTFQWQPAAIRTLWNRLLPLPDRHLAALPDQHACHLRHNGSDHGHVDRSPRRDLLLPRSGARPGRKPESLFPRQ
jgi:hypothetical protein